jgi:hypothetical protein
MQTLMQQRFAGLQALRLRSVIATSEFYSMIGKEAPVQNVRFQVKNVGNAYHVVDLVTDKTKAFRWTYAAAVDFAMQLEEKAKRQPEGAK